MQPVMARRHSNPATGWAAPAAQAVATADRANRQRASSVERQEAVEGVVEDVVEELSMDDMMPRASGGSFMVTPSEEGEERGGIGCALGLLSYCCCCCCGGGGGG